MINDFFSDLFGSLDLGDNEAICIYIFGCLMVVGVFQLLKMFLKLLLKR